MAEYIEREAAIAEMDVAFPAAPSSEFSKGVAVGLAMAKLAVCHLPAADVRPVVRGKWKKAPCHETDEAYTYICPFCRWYMIAIEPMNFCPNCGARMEES